MKKLAYGGKVHRDVTNKIVPRTATKAVRQQIIDGAVKADESIRHPYLPWTDPIHSFGGSQDRAQIDKNINERLDAASKDVARGLISKGVKRDVFLAKGFADYGEATHMLMDRTAHFDKPLSGGSAAVRSRQILGTIGAILPGYGGLGIGAVEHMSDVDPDDLAKGKDLTESIGLDKYRPKTDADDRKVLGNMRSIRRQFEDSVRAHLESGHSINPTKARHLARNMYKQEISDTGRKWGGRLRDAAYAGREVLRAAKTLRPAIVKAGSAQRMKIIAVGPEYGAGHISQAKAIHQAAKKRGIDAEIVDFHETFGNPKARKAFGKSYKRTLRGEISSLPATAYNAAKSLLQTDSEKIERFSRENQDAAIITTLPATRHALRGMSNPLYISHADYSTNPMDSFPGVPRAIDATANGERIHLGPKTSLQGIGSPTKIRTQGLPVSQRALNPSKKRVFGKGNFNVTVSGGGYGLDVAEVVNKIHSHPDLPDNAVIHGVAGRDKGQLSKLKKLEKKTNGRVRAHGFAPLPEMMHQADLNIVRAHGTSMTEARAAGKPALFFSRKAKLTDPQSNLVAEEVKQGRTLGIPGASTLDEIPDTLSGAMKNYSKLQRKSQRDRQQVGDPASDLVDKVVRDFQKRRKARR